MTFRPGTVVRTRGGWPVEIIDVLSAEQQATTGDCVIGVMVHACGSREILTWQRDGRFDPRRGGASLDLELPNLACIAEAAFQQAIMGEANV